MDLDLKLVHLKEIYQRHNAFFAQRKAACRKFCASCCSCNVTLTTLEGYLIVSSLGLSRQSHQMPALRQTLAGKRFQPQVTTNGLAALCMQGQPVPEETNDPRWGACPFLDQDACTIYNVRPFGCRAMMSQDDCSRTGFADMDALALTINHLLLQAIEHLDHNGLSGNLSDIIQFFITDGMLEAYRVNDLSQPTNGLIRNQPIKMLMVPPEHRTQVEPLLRSLGFLFK